MAIPDVNFDAAGVLTHQPRTINVKHLPPPEDTAVNGGSLGIAWDKNKEITMVWADDPAHATYAALVSLRNSLRGHTVTWNNPDGNSAGTFKVDWPHDPDYSITPGRVFSEITVRLRQRPD